MKQRLWSLFFVVLCLLTARVQAAELSITFAAIGQGDAALVISPTGKTVLIDGGPPEGTEHLLQVLQQRKVTAIDLIILTHPHLDHLGGLSQVIRRMPVRMFLDSGFPSTSPPYVTLLRTLSERGVTVKNATMGRSIDLGDGAALTILGPPSPFLESTRSDVNANSVVARLAWKGRSALFTGDAEPEAERAMLERNASQPALLQAELLKVAHHGGRYSSTEAFLRAVSPRIAVISCGIGNDYGHPTVDAMNRIQAVQATLYRTDLQGDVTVTTRDGQPWQVSTEQLGPVVSAASHGAGPTKAPGATTVRPTQSDAVRLTPSAAATSPASQRFVASANSQLFHKPDCPAAARISPKNLLTFTSRAVAVQSGRQPAGDCQP
ncbi:MAG: MBL fold metallo-hydrolase [Myxococcales bacterium]|nr:MBL fold metallo-hydrolase [Myxococcales bacterium]